MNALVCDICGGKLVIQSGGVAKCESCGMEYTKERIQEKVQEIKGTVKVDGPVETVKGDAEKERLLNMANDCLNKGNLAAARRIYTAVSAEYSNDWRGWWGIIRSTPIEISEPDRGNWTSMLSGEKIEERSIKETISKIRSGIIPSWIYEYETALSFAPRDKKVTLQQYYESWSVKYKKYIINLIIHKANQRIAELNSEAQKYSDELHDAKKELDELLKECKAKRGMGAVLLIVLVLAIVAFIYIPNFSVGWLFLIVPVGVGGGLALLTSNSDINERKSSINSTISTCNAFLNNKNENINKIKKLVSELERN